MARELKVQPPEVIEGMRKIPAANYIYVGKSDGLTLGLISPALFFDQIGGRKEVQFDWSKFALDWLSRGDR